MKVWLSLWSCCMRSQADIEMEKTTEIVMRLMR